MILLTGITSFTGFHIAKELAEKYEVYATLTRKKIDYTGLKRKRIENLPKKIQLIEETSFGDKKFHDLLSEKPFISLCHHGAEVSNYNSPDFDYLQAVYSNTNNIESVLKLFKEKGGKNIIITGSVFENYEGYSDKYLEGLNNYGLSKYLSFEIWKHFGLKNDMKLGKFVIPNPFGLYEEERFNSYVINNWLKGNPVALKTPEYIRDNIPVDYLAEKYIEFHESLIHSKETFMKCSPSGYHGTMQDFTRLLASKLTAKKNLDCKIQKTVQEDFSQPITRLNAKESSLLNGSWDEQRFWEEYLTYYIQNA